MTQSTQIPPEEIRSISQIDKNNYLLVLVNGESISVPFDILPEEINHESPEQTIESAKVCPICDAHMKEVYVFSWKTEWKGGKLIGFNRENWVERIDRYECDACNRFRFFDWEVADPDLVRVAYYQTGEWYVRYKDIPAPFTRFAINDRSGLALMSVRQNKPGFSFYLVCKETSESMSFRLDQISRHSADCQIVYNALADKNIREVNGVYVTSNWTDARRQK